MRKTKMVCTIGPSSNNKEVFSKMCKAGMNVARLNFSHGTHEDHQKNIDMIKEVREDLKNAAYSEDLNKLMDAHPTEYEVEIVYNVQEIRAQKVDNSEAK